MRKYYFVYCAGGIETNRINFVSDGLRMSGTFAALDN